MSASNVSVGTQVEGPAQIAVLEARGLGFRGFVIFFEVRRISRFVSGFISWILVLGVFGVLGLGLWGFRFFGGIWGFRAGGRIRAMCAAALLKNKGGGKFGGSGPTASGVGAEFCSEF